MKNIYIKPKFKARFLTCTENYQKGFCGAQNLPRVDYHPLFPGNINAYNDENSIKVLFKHIFFIKRATVDRNNERSYEIIKILPYEGLSAPVPHG